MSDHADKPDARLTEVRAKWEKGHTAHAVLRMNDGFEVVVVSESRPGAWCVTRYFEAMTGWLVSQDLDAGDMAGMFRSLEKAVK